MRDAVRVDTVEHLLAALVSLGIDNVIVELNSPEVPIMDGSAAPFVYLIQEAGVRALDDAAALPEGAASDFADSRRQAHRAVSVRPFQGHLQHRVRSSAAAAPVAHDSSDQRFVRGRDRAGAHLHVPKEVEMLRQQGLALGGSLENAVVIGDTGILNNALRFDDEFVRHKILDVIGDMALVGHPIIGHLVAHRGGHALHTAFAAQVLEERDAWTLVESAVEPVAADARHRFRCLERRAVLAGSDPAHGMRYRRVFRPAFRVYRCFCTLPLSAYFVSFLM